MLASAGFKSRSYHATEHHLFRPPYSVASAECLPVYTDKTSASSTVSGSTSLLMMRTPSAVRCRGIYRLRDTSRSREQRGEARACKKRPRFIVGKFPSWRILPEMMADGVKEEGEATEFFFGRVIRPRVCGRFLSAG